MNFGEIVEPTSRALWDDDYEENSENLNSNLEWQGFKKPPQTIETILLADTTNTIKILHTCLLNSKTLLCEIKQIKLEIHDLGKGRYVLLCPERNSLGEIIANIVPWFQQSKHTFVITSAPLALYQCSRQSDSQDCKIYTLSTKENLRNNNYPKLATPNLVTGLGAAVFSYCVHMNKSCELFVGFTDQAPLDSLTAEPFVKLLSSYCKMGTILPFVSHHSIPSHNLYM